MPPKEIENGKIYYDIDEELKPMGNAVELTSEPKREIMISDEDIDKLTVGMDINLQWTLVPMRKLLCNNWRKMHHLPLIRRRGKRK